MRRPCRLLIPLLVVATLVAAACGGSDDSPSDSSGPSGTTDAAPDVGSAGPTGEPLQGGTLRYALASETNTWDPAAAQFSASGWTVARAIFDTLVDYDDQGQWKPYLAESFEPNDDHTQWIITPRSGITFHNGEVLDAQLVANNVERYSVAPLTASVFDDLESIEVVGETVVITLSRSWVNFPLIFTDRPGTMVAQEMIDDPDGGSSPIGTGPFVFESWIVDDKLSVTANPDYWNGPVYVDGIDFTIITDGDSRERALTSGQFDVSPFTGTKQIADLEAAEGDDLQVFIDDGEEVEVLFLINLDRPPFDDIRVRQALVLAHDREAQINATGQGLYVPASGIYAPDSPWFADTGYPEPDPDRARELVEEWEAETGEPLTLKMGSTQEAETVRNLQFVLEEWEAVGIDVELVPQEQADYINSTLIGDYDVNIWQFYNASHPDGEYSYLHSKFAPEEGLSPNFGRIRDDVIDSALDEARGEPDPDRQKELYGEIQQAMTDGYYHVWMYHDRNALTAQPNVGNVTVWTFPDETPGRPLRSVYTKLTSVWLDQG